ncbi:hypothetical protein BJX96DRAFT_183640 [Aspergillus floccosus]
MAISTRRSRRRAASMPLLPSYHRHLREIDYQKDVANSSFEYPFSAQTDIENTIEAFYHTLRVRHIDISRLVFERFKSKLLEMQDTRDNKRLILRLFRQPMQLSNEDQGRVLQIRDAIQRNRVSAIMHNENAHRFYIRSWVFEPWQLLCVVRTLRGKGFRFSELDEWEFQCCLSRWGRVTVRYVGMIKGRRDFVQRSQLDIDEKPPSSLFGAFRDTVKRIFPGVHDRLGIHELPQMAVSVIGGSDAVGNQLTADDIERLLIQLFDNRSLLNLQDGGQYINYLPDTDDEKLYTSMKPSAFERFSRDCTPFPEPEWCGLAEDFLDIEKHARTHAELYLFHEAYFQAMQEEARPYQFLGNTVLLFLGEELSQKHLRAGHTFLHGSASASVLVRGLISRIRHIGHEWSNRGPMGNLASSFTFVNALPLPGYNDIPQALQFLDKYLRCVEPVMIATFGRRSSDTVASGFTKSPLKKSTSNGVLEAHVEVSIRSYGNDQEAVIHIPLSHPGKYQYGRRDASRIRLFYLQLQLVYVIADCAMEVLAQQRSTLGKSARRDVCLSILHHAKERLQKCCVILASTDDALQICLAKTSQVTRVPPCRPGCGSLLKRKAEAIKEEFTSPIYGQATFDRILSLGRARGLPHSPEREAHLKDLWAQNVPELHSIIAHTPELHSKWIGELMDLQQGQSYFLKLLSQAPDHAYMEALARVCNSIGRHKKRFDAITSSTEVRSGLWVSREVIQAYRPDLSPRVKTEDMQGFPVEIKSNGVIKVKWLTQEGLKKTVTIDGLEYAIPQNGLECRSLSFTEHSIDIVDASGRPIRPYEPWEKSPPSATVPRWKFKSKEGQLLQELWEAVRRFQKKKNGVGLVSSSSRTEIPKQNRPPKIKDANYLLYHFLIERFPDGGIFRTASREKDPTSTEDLRAFVDFCKKKEYSTHPYSAKWLEMLDRTRPFVAILAPNIKVYRSCRKRITYPPSPRPG